MGTANAVFYGLSGVVLTGLVYGGWIYPKSVKADPGMLLSTVGIRLQLASAIPFDSENKKASEVRNETLQQVTDVLDQVEAEVPGMGIVREYRAYREWLERDYEKAIDWYRQSLAAKNNGPKLIKRVHLNLSLVLLEAGKSLAALKTLEEMPVEHRDIRWPLTGAKIHNARNDAPARTQALKAALKVAGDNDDLKLGVAHAAYELGDEMALELYEGQNNKTLQVRYRIAHLMASAGRIVDAVVGLKELDEKGGKFLESRLAEDLSFWQPLAENDEFLKKSIKKITSKAGAIDK